MFTQKLMNNEGFRDTCFKVKKSIRIIHHFHSTLTNLSYPIHQFPNLFIKRLELLSFGSKNSLELLVLGEAPNESLGDRWIHHPQTKAISSIPPLIFRLK